MGPGCLLAALLVCAGCGGNGGQQDAGSDGGTDAGSICTTSSQCTLLDNCCDCMVLVPNQKAPPCDIPECFQSKCAELNLDPGGDAQCIAGNCVFGFDCFTGQVTCDMPTPLCAAGEVPSVRNACYGACVKASECSSVPECSACDRDKAICVTMASQRPSYHCVVVPAECKANRTCACLGKTVCTGAFSLCADQSGSSGISCDCPNC